MVKRERDPRSLFAASPSLWPFPPVAPAGRPVRVADAFFLVLKLLPFPLLANEKGAGREDTPSCRLANTRSEAAGKRLSSLDVTALLHGGFGAGLGLGERLVHGHGSRERRREVLANVRSHTLELGDGDELHARIRYRLYGRVVRVGRVDRIERQLSERRSLQIVGVLVEGGARSGRNGRDPLLGGDEIEVVLACRPRHELLGSVRILRASWNTQRP